VVLVLPRQLQEHRFTTQAAAVVVHTQQTQPMVALVVLAAVVMVAVEAVSLPLVQPIQAVAVVELNTLKPLVHQAAQA
jgi:hypothetical protein